MGPGSYTIGTGVEGPMKSMGATLTFDAKVKEAKMKPGPGQYNLDHNIVKRAITAFSIGTDKRVDKLHEQTIKSQLSPTQYQPDSRITKSAGASYGFGTQRRMVVSQMRNRQRNVSPDSYQIPSSITDGRKTAMHGR